VLTPEAALPMLATSESWPGLKTRPWWQEAVLTISSSPLKLLRIDTVDGERGGTTFESRSAKLKQIS